MKKSTNKQNSIEFDNQPVEIINLMFKLTNLLKQGYTKISFEIIDTGYGTNENGSYEFEYQNILLNPLKSNK